MPKIPSSAKPDAGYFIKLQRFATAKRVQMHVCLQSPIGAVECLLTGQLPEQVADKLAARLGLPVERVVSSFEDPEDCTTLFE